MTAANRQPRILYRQSQPPSRCHRSMPMPPTHPQYIMISRANESVRGTSLRVSTSAARVRPQAKSSFANPSTTYRHRGCAVIYDAASLRFDLVGQSIVVFALAEAPFIFRHARSIVGKMLLVGDRRHLSNYFLDLRMGQGLIAEVALLLKLILHKVVMMVNLNDFFIHNLIA